ncbi:MAG TPA: hypothetical protein VJU81_15055 [Methylomirabilota bacterium]|nr:hypothetical protein [Methylomirabilota bacterium]
MARYLHLVGADANPLAAPVIARPEPGAEVTVVLLDGGAAPALPDGARVLRFGPDVDYAALLDLIFEADHVIHW